MKCSVIFTAKPDENSSQTFLKLASANISVRMKIWTILTQTAFVLWRLECIETTGS